MKDNVWKEMLLLIMPHNFKVINYFSRNGRTTILFNFSSRVLFLNDIRMYNTNNSFLDSP